MRFTNLKDSRVLILDDQANNLHALAAVIEFAGCQNIKCLGDSREALAIFIEFQPDLILLDLHMPHLDGLAVMDQLRTVVPAEDYLPILVLTGDNSSAAKEKVLAYGASDILSKPLNHTEVELRVKNLLQTRWLHQQLKKQNLSLERQVLESRSLAEELAQTNRRLRETQGHLVQSEKMASLGELVAGIAHEINNPLAFVINNIFITQEELARWEATQNDSPAVSSLRKMRTRVEHMREGAERVQNLVSKLRTFSRLDEGTLKTVDIHESIESVLLFLGHKMEDRIQVERRYAAKEPLTCLAGELNQVIMNVIGNAIDSIDGTGTIRVSTSERDGQFVLTVRDSGKGIPQKIRDRIFDPFFTTKPIGSGTGLGLSISYGIVKAHHGSIDFSSEEGKGTEFTVKIPTSLQPEVSA